MRFIDRTRTNLSKPKKSIINWHFLKKQKARYLLEKTNKLHLGCGHIRIENYINIDAVLIPEVDFRCRLNKLYDFFPENSISEIYICHALEHLPARFVSLYLEQFYYILKKNGILRISVPDIDKIMATAKMKEWSDNEIELLQGVVGGGQDHKYNYHKTFFWPEYLRRKLVQANFRNIEEYPLRPHFTNQNIVDASNGAGFKPFGVGLSLNMKAEK
ncbi:methyltransferase [Thermodesulfobacteriota bacterium]